MTFRYFIMANDAAKTVHKRTAMVFESRFAGQSNIIETDKDGNALDGSEQEVKKKPTRKKRAVKAADADKQ